MTSRYCTLATRPNGEGLATAQSTSLVLERSCTLPVFQRPSIRFHSQQEINIFKSSSYCQDR